MRIALGGPEDNPFTAEALSAAGSAYAKELGARLEGGGTARLWLPAARDRAGTFVPGADLRGEADLPVLIVAGSGGPARRTGRAPWPRPSPASPRTWPTPWSRCPPPISRTG